MLQKIHSPHSFYYPTKGHAAHWFFGKGHTQWSMVRGTRGLVSGEPSGTRGQTQSTHMQSTLSKSLGSLSSPATLLMLL